MPLAQDGNLHYPILDEAVMPRGVEHTVLYTHTTWTGTTFQVVIKEHFTL